MNRGGEPQASHVKMPRFCLGVQTEPHAHPAAGSGEHTLRTPVLPGPRATSGLLLASQIQMNDLQLLADDTHVFPSLHLYLGDSCDTDKPLYCWENTSPSSNLTQLLPSHSWCLCPNQDRDKKQVYKVRRPHLCCPTTQERRLLLVRMNEVKSACLCSALRLPDLLSSLWPWW